MQYADTPTFKKYFKSTESVGSDDLISIDCETYASGLSISNDTLPSIHPRYIKKRNVRPPRMKNKNYSGLDNHGETEQDVNDDFVYEYGFSVSSRHNPTLNALALESISRVVPSHRSNTPNGTPASLFWDGINDPDDYLPTELNSEKNQHPLSHMKYSHGSSSQSIATEDMVSYYNGNDRFSITSRRDRGLKSIVELDGISVASSRYIDLNTHTSDGISLSDTLSSGSGSVGNDSFLSSYSDETEKTNGGSSIMKYSHTPSFRKYFKSSSTVSSDDMSYGATSATSSYQKRGLNSLGIDNLSVSSSTRGYPFHRPLNSIASSGVSLGNTSTSTSLSSGGWSTESDDDDSTPTELNSSKNGNGWSWPWQKKYLDENK